MDKVYALGVLLVVLGGVALAMQAGINAALARATDSRAFAAVVSFALGLAVCAAYLAVDAAGLRHGLPTPASLRAAPWWSWVGGLLGAFYVIVVIIFAEKLGAGTIVAVFVCAQLLTSVALDLTGLVGFARRGLSWPRLVGAGLMIMGVVLVTQWPGQVLARPSPLIAAASSTSSRRPLAAASSTSSSVDSAGSSEHVVQLAAAGAPQPRKLAAADGAAHARAPGGSSSGDPGG